MFFQWRVNGTNLSGATSSAFSLSNALATDAGNYSVVVSNINGAVTSSNAALVLNHLPVAPTVTVTRPSGFSFKFSTATVLTNCSDADGDTLTLASVISPTTNNATVFKSGSLILYSPSATNADVTDRFNYTVSDGFGGVSTGAVVVVVQGQTNASPTLGAGSLTMSNGVVTLKLFGIPNFTYYIQAATNISSPAWATIGTNVAGTNGVFFYIDYAATNYPSRFYRYAAP